MHIQKITDLGCKEVINICDGARYGYVSDAEIDIVSGKLVAIIVECETKFPCFWAKRDDAVIPWESIKRVGDDIILVDYQLQSCSSCKKPGLFSR